MPDYYILLCKTKYFQISYFMNKQRNYFLWMGLSLIHVFLFYEQSLGFNALIFSCIVVTLITWQQRATLMREMNWKLAVAGHMIAAIAVAWHASIPGMLIYHLSFFVLAGYVFSVKSSFPVAFFNGIVAGVSGAFLAAIPRFIKDASAKSKGFGFSFQRTVLYVAPISVTVLFYIFYSAANPDFMLDIKWSGWEPDFPLIGYSVLSIILLCPLFFAWGLKILVQYDAAKPDRLERIRMKHGRHTALALKYENKQGNIMFLMLNTLIGIFLIFNVLQIFIPSLGTQSSGHSEQVHQGFFTLVISIVFAILLIMYYFRANQNFYRGNHLLVRLALVWIILNAALALFTCYKNMLYVDAFGLTYKRIWVFVGMLLTGVGLYLTTLKIRKLKTNWYLLRQTSWVLYFAFTLCCLVDWDRIIAFYNINYAKELDTQYIYSLGNTGIPYLRELAEKNDPRLESNIKDRLQVRIDNFEVSKSWKSRSLDEIWLKEKFGK